MNKVLEEGKLDSQFLKENIIDKITYKNEDVTVRAGVGEDCATVNYGDYDCVISTDPITASINDIGRLSIHISCNDIASNGVKPLAIVLTVMLPVGTRESDVITIMEQATKTAEELEVEIVGGHTEVTSAVNKPVIVSTAFGKTIKGSSAKAEDMQAEDLIIMTKFAGIEGTGIIISDKEDEVKTFLSKEEIEDGKALLDKVSVIKEGLIASEIGTNGMHDITEGGVLGAIWEMCQISHKGCFVEEEKINILDITKKVCKKYELNPLRLISSGSMIIICKEENRNKMLNSLKVAGIESSVIGKITSQKTLELKKISGEIVSIEPPKSDELYKVI